MKKAGFFCESEADNWEDAFRALDTSELYGGLRLVKTQPQGADMLRYFFNIRDGHPIITDNVGIDLPDLEAAIKEAHKKPIWLTNFQRQKRAVSAD